MGIWNLPESEQRGASGADVCLGQSGENEGSSVAGAECTKEAALRERDAGEAAARKASGCFRALWASSQSLSEMASRLGC